MRKISLSQAEGAGDKEMARASQNLLNQQKVQVKKSFIMQLQSSYVLLFPLSLCSKFH